MKLILKIPGMIDLKEVHLEEREADDTWVTIDETHDVNIWRDEDNNLKAAVYPVKDGMTYTSVEGTPCEIIPTNKYSLVAFNESNYTAMEAFRKCEGIHILDFELKGKLTAKLLDEVTYGLCKDSKLSSAVYATTQTATLLDSKVRMGFYLIQAKGTVPEGTPPVAANTFAIWRMINTGVDL